MLKFALIILLLLCAHFSLTPLAPSPKAWAGWPFGADSKPWVVAIGLLPAEVGRAVTSLLALVAGLCFLLGVLGLLWAGFPPAWWSAIVTAGALASALLFGLYFSPLAILPVVLDAAVLWAVSGGRLTLAVFR